VTDERRVAVEQRRKGERRQQERREKVGNWHIGGRRHTPRRAHGGRNKTQWKSNRLPWDRRKYNTADIKMRALEKLEGFGEIAQAVLTAPEEDVQRSNKPSEVELPKSSFLDWAAVYREELSPTFHGITEDRTDEPRRMFTTETRRNHLHWSHYLRATR